MTPQETLDLLYQGMPDRPVDDDDVRHFFGAGMYVRMSFVKSGESIRMHVHGYDHLTIAFGWGDLVSDDGTVEIKPGAVIEVKAGKRHAYTAKTDTIWYCIHPTTEDEAKKLYGSGPH